LAGNELIGKKSVEKKNIFRGVPPREFHGFTGIYGGGDPPLNVTFFSMSAW
jgi:hypothetical protein